MTADRIPIEASYLHHLRSCGMTSVVDLRPSLLGEGEGELRQALASFLLRTSNQDRQWTYSSLGSLTGGKNLTVLNLLAQHAFGVTFRMPEISKVASSRADAGFSEIVFTASNKFIESILLTSKLAFDVDLKLSGWLLEGEQFSKHMHSLKFESGQFTIPKEGVCSAFVSSDDWDCVQFLSPHPDEVMNALASSCELRE